MAAFIVLATIAGWFFISHVACEAASLQMLPTIEQTSGQNCSC
ncbi:hypothetical protein FHX05_006200 [Rhizobium sp. BK491]|nr:hypothetical protein [Rhizobium sp. BK491]